ncbi:sensor domain-containing diguanylate cyclase [Domibacillus iocasae]|uniref:Diguanylate cyclase n=1 Tax=Domibacillus iocasae TaxID=1714016 RepID=A0A1E7DR33_9BACI|nr:diguanylate cyclase [Domibacillus iocasae]OES45499.1 hypothetical protein BA724_01375 [Domibacillus iocasae]
MEHMTYVYGEHHLILAFFSIMIAICSSYTALHLVSRIRLAEKGIMRNYWLIAASISMGTGIWAMHFIGMLAFHIYLDVGYNPLLVAVSMILPVMTSYLAFYMLSQYVLRRYLIVSGTIVGIGILLMHYIGMKAMIVKAEIQYDPVWVTASVLIALASTNIAVQLFALFRDNPVYNNLWAKPAAALLIGTAISGMHYTGMKAATFLTTSDYQQDFPHDWSENNPLAISIVIIILCIQGFIFISCYMDQKTSLKIKESEERYRQLVELSPIAIGIHKSGVFTYINPAGMKILGANALEEVVGQNPLSFIHPSYHEIVKERLKMMFENKTPAAPLEEKMMRVDGKIVDVEIMGLPITIHGQDHVQVFFQDISERKKLEEMMYHFAYHDTLTGLPNRRLFEEHLQRAVLDKPAEPKVTAVMFIDLDGFKQVNDLYGHDAGDTLLNMIAEKLTIAVRKSDVVARLAGDEFTILLTDIEKRDVIGIAKRILDMLGLPFSIKNKSIRITPSIGISFHLHEREDGHSLIRKADTAMYQAKRTGKNTYRIYRDD